MTGGRGDAPLPPAANGGEFLLSLIQKPHQQPLTTPQPPLLTAPTLLSPQQQQQQQSLALDPAIAAVGPSIAFRQPQWPSNGRDHTPSLTNPPWPHNLFPPLHPNFVGYPQFPVNHFPANPFMGNQRLLADDLHKLGFPGNANYAIHNLVQHDKQEPQQLLFGSLPHNVVRRPDGLLNGSLSDNSKFSPKDREREPRNRQLVNSNTNSNLSQNSSQNRSFDSCEPERKGAGTGGWAKHHHNGNHKSTVPPGFSGKQRGGNWDSASNNGMSRRKSSGYNVDKEKGAQSKVSDRAVHLNGEEERLGRLSIEDGDDVGLTGQLDRPGPSSGNSLQSVPASDIEESLLDLHREVLENRDRKKPNRDGRLRREDEEVAGSLLAEDEADGNDEKKQHRQSREKESRIDSRGQWLLSQRMRNLKRQMVCRGDIDGLNAPFLAIYESLVPTEEERAKQKHLLALLEKLVSKEWPGARLYLYGSCANSFGVSKSDIDVCLAVEDLNLDKSEILLKLADILKSDNLQNVQALTRARVPIVKLMDPATGISCDICINNVLAVVNTKLLRDYAQIDARLHQLAFIVKHWAKSRGVNQTYQGTLSSYAYVLMCIHFLQQRQPAILPCLQGMETTYSVTVDDIECSYFDQVERLRNFGSYNKETTAQLVWAFFNYWAYRHDYANAVVSVRTGSILSKREKDWTRRIGNDRHLICIEDPFEISHDLGRVVDKFSIKVLREEFERAADIMQHDPNPCVTLFEPYVPR